ncbi:MAG: flagellar motor protein MotB [Candidatus Marinimicrobia bacterium]|nr:flagellar motor protein MotB [Candidatus Neomarinimicrobiota bacterium]MCF7922162.1 flagellar motor protein MotB [Candidatus Neomarinimicrobiota bacterium]
MKIKTISHLILSSLVILGLTNCAGSNQDLVQEQDAELVKLRGDLETLDGQLKAEKNLVKQLEQAKSELTQKLDTEQLKRIRKQAQVDSLQKAIEAGSVIGNRISLPNAVLFKSGSADLTERGKVFIDKVGETLARYPNREIMIEGHSDNVPIGKKYRWKYLSNWELSSARALVVLHYLEEKQNINPKRLGAVAYGEERPLVNNLDPQSRAKNRRVEIVIGQVIEKPSN